MKWGTPRSVTTIYLGIAATKCSDCHLGSRRTRRSVLSHILRVAPVLQFPPQTGRQLRTLPPISQCMLGAWRMMKLVSFSEHRYSTQLPAPSCWVLNLWPRLGLLIIEPKKYRKNTVQLSVNNFCSVFLPCCVPNAKSVLACFIMYHINIITERNTTLETRICQKIPQQDMTTISVNNSALASVDTVLEKSKSEINEGSESFTFYMLFVRVETQKKWRHETLLWGSAFSHHHVGQGRKNPLNFG